MRFILTIIAMLSAASLSASGRAQVPVDPWHSYHQPDNSWQKSTDLPPTMATTELVAELAPPVKPNRRMLKATFGSTWLAGEGDDFGMTDVRLGTTLGLPLPLVGIPLIVSPSFRVSFLDGPVTSDLPAQLYNASVMVGVMQRQGERVSFNFGITPGVASDFAVAGNGFRAFAHGTATYQWTPTVQLMLGAAYLDRNDISILPVVGLVWTPRDDIRFDFSAPRPKFARRISHDWKGTEDWLYLAGELGGGTWAIRRTSGVDDEVTIRDFRILTGWERRVPGGMNTQMEAGYVFGRKVEYLSGTADIEPSGTLMIRAGVTH